MGARTGAGKERRKSGAKAAHSAQAFSCVCLVIDEGE
jgi:hypothetical protein